MGRPTVTRETILTTDTALQSLWSAVNAKRRKGSTAIKVDAEGLTAILKDHHTLLTALSARKLLAVTLNADQESLKP